MLDFQYQFELLLVYSCFPFDQNALFLFCTFFFFFFWFPFHCSRISLNLESGDSIGYSDYFHFNSVLSYPESSCFFVVYFLFILSFYNCFSFFINTDQWTVLYIYNGLKLVQFFIKVRR